MTGTAQIITSYGHRYTVRTPNGKTCETSTYKKRVDFACGDRVYVQTVNAEQAVVRNCLPRESLLYCQDARKTKLITANISQLLIVTAAVPLPSEILLQRVLLVVEVAGVRAIIVLNKAGLPETALWREKLKSCETLGYPVIGARTPGNADILHSVLQGHTNILLGQSGMGKSTLTNVLLGNQAARTGDISTAFDSGKHTTTHAQLYDLNEEIQLIDSPGLQEFGPHYPQAADPLQYFPDLNYLVGQCRLRSCTHCAEPGYVVKVTADNQKVLAEWVAFLQRIMDELRR